MPATAETQNLGVLEYGSNIRKPIKQNKTKQHETKKRNKTADTQNLGVLEYGSSIRKPNKEGGERGERSERVEEGERGEGRWKRERGGKGNPPVTLISAN